MSLETLLEAAEFIDCERDKNGRTRVKHTEAFHPSAKHEQVGPPKSPKSRVAIQKIRTRSASGTSTDEEPLPVPLPTKYSAIASGNRDLHNRLEKNRRAQLKSCFEHLKLVIPAFEDERKASNLSILRSATRQIQTLLRQETELEIEMQRLARHKIMAQERMAQLRNELAAMNMDVDLTGFMLSEAQDDNNSTSTATADNDDPIMSDDDGQSSSTLSTTSTTPGTPVFKIPSSCVSPQKSPRSMQLAINLATTTTATPAVINTSTVTMGYQETDGSQATTIISDPSITKAVTMQSILNRTLLGASTSVLSSLTSQSPQATLRPMGQVVKNIALLNQAQTSHKVQGPQTSMKSSVNQLLQKTLQQRQQMKKETTNQFVLSQDGKVIASGPSSITKMVSENQANCHINSGINLSSLTTAHLNTPTTSNANPQYMKTSTSNWSNPPSITDGPVQLSHHPHKSEPEPAAIIKGNSGTNTIPLKVLLPSLFPPTTTQPKPMVTATTFSLPAAAVSSNLGTNVLTLQPVSTANTTTTSSRPTPIIPAPAPFQAQMITPAQLQQLLLQASFQQQLFPQQHSQQQHQHQKVAVLQQQPTTSQLQIATSLASASVAQQPQIQIAANSSQLAAQLLSTQNAAAVSMAGAGGTSASTTNVNQINFPTLQMAQLISPLPMVSPNMQLASNLGQFAAGVQLSQLLSPQVLKTFGQVPVLQPSALTLPMKPVVMVSLPNMVMAASSSPATSTMASPHIVTTKPASQ